MQYVKRSSNRSHLTGRDHLYIYSDIINFEEIPILIGGLAIDWPKFYRCVAPHKCRAWHKIISKMDQPPTAAINNKWSVIVCVWFDFGIWLHYLTNHYLLRNVISHTVLKHKWHRHTHDSSLLRGFHDLFPHRVLGSWCVIISYSLLPRIRFWSCIRLIHFVISNSTSIFSLFLSSTYAFGCCCCCCLLLFRTLTLSIRRLLDNNIFVGQYFAAPRYHKHWPNSQSWRMFVWIWRYQMFCYMTQSLWVQPWYSI